MNPLRFSPPPSAPIGLGDAVAAVAQPIARVVDAVAGTTLVSCAACAARKAALNSAVPDLLRPVIRH